MRLATLCVLVVAMGLPCGAHAEDKYSITPKEKLACTQDAMRLCYHTYPDEDAMIACMKQNHASLTPMCRVAFDAGIKRRRL